VDVCADDAAARADQFLVAVGAGDPKTVASTRQAIRRAIPSTTSRGDHP
jgi:hypothetical protein